MNTRAVTAVASIISALVLVLAWQQTTEAGVTGENDDHEAVVVRNNVARGVERWSIKTGTEGQAKQVRAAKSVNTTIYYLIYLQPHAESRSFDDSAQIVPASGRVSWSWHAETSGSGGTATVSCSYHGVTKIASARFAVG
jgi:hypothetical protein